MLDARLALRLGVVCCSVATGVYVKGCEGMLRLSRIAYACVDTHDGVVNRTKPSQAFTSVFGCSRLGR
jgi:hypothetical protein